MSNPIRRQALAQTPWPDVGPVVVDVLQARGTLGFAKNSTPAIWNVGECGPQTVLLFIVDQDEEAAMLIVERIDAHPSLQLLGSELSAKHTT